VHYPGKRELYGYIVEQQAALQKAQLKSSVAELPDNRAKVETPVRFVISSARAHIAETTEDEWMQEYEIAADLDVPLLHLVEEEIGATRLSRPKVLYVLSAVPFASAAVFSGQEVHLDCDGLLASGIDLSVPDERLIIVGGRP
jgi:hypothetical protein